MFCVVLIAMVGNKEAGELVSVTRMFFLIVFFFVTIVFLFCSRMFCYTCFFCFLFWFFGPKACGILAPQPRIEPTSPALEGTVLSPEPPGKSL